MKQLLIFATSYPYTALILAVLWIGSAVLVSISSRLPLELMLLGNVGGSTCIAIVGFRK